MNRGRQINEYGIREERKRKIEDEVKIENITK